AGAGPNGFDRLFDRAARPSDGAGLRRAVPGSLQPYRGEPAMSIHWLLLAFLLGRVGLPVWATALPGAAPIPAPTPDSVVTRLALQVQLRTEEGTPVPGIALMLQPASPDLGGPSLNTPVQSGLTDAKCGVIFTALGQ